MEESMEFVPPHCVMVRPATCRILIANFQPIVRHGLRALLASEPYFEVAHFAGPCVHHQVLDAGHNLPQEAKEAFADAILDVAKLRSRW